ncbi:MAG: transglycosylase SLT domain-containing protein [Deltaproteobacteria bacterium]|nr:transglycosylase SLT domain-containing protein [Deltaproteobacteria bacterium]MCB9787446.1 transglycosylase SLT domain-containing protein [Deltaproteobacteria bacterium]
MHAIPLLALLITTFAACEASRPAAGPVAAPPPPPVVAAAPAPPPEPPAAPAPAAPAAPLTERLETVADLTPYFTEPELRAAVDDFEAGRNHPAARALEALADAEPDTPRGRAARFVALLARHDGGVFDPTAAGLEEMATRWPALRDYALFYAASAHLHAGRPAEALRVLDAMPEDTTLAARTAELRVEALVAADRKPEALEAAEAAVAADPDERPGLWLALIELRGSSDRVDDARRELASRFPSKPEGRMAMTALGSEPDFDATQQLRIARFYAGAQAHDRAIEALTRTLSLAPPQSPVACEALTLLARTWEKKKQASKAWPYFKLALSCKGEPLADATFAGGRNRLAAGDRTTARKLFQRHIATFPERSTVDDVQLMIAQSYRETGEDKVADERLLELLTRWPDGDMVDEAAWALLWPHVEAHRWKYVLAMADRVLKLVPRESSYRAEGRTLYWRARALDRLGKVGDAEAGYGRVLAEYPLSWYAVLAYGRLRARDPEAASSALHAAIAASRPPPDPLAALPASLLADRHFLAGVALARMGLQSSARREIAATAAPPPADRLAWTWTRVVIYQLAGAWEQATRLSRAEEPRFGALWPVGPMRALWELAHPRPFAPLVDRWASARGIDPHWVWSIMREESGFNPRIESWANAIGLMQIILPTARMLARGTDIEPTRENLQKPEVAIELGTKYLASLLARHPIVSLASAGYNAGGGAVAKWRRLFGEVDLDEFVERIPYREARGYAKRVTRSLARYHWLYGGETMLELPLGPPGR